mmetsp:Transcript_27411/g.59965  ORF Transcript_27411/g.59965 Transcript_27411/m.59965 type:complete len:90 (-) Transcript_27411:144-413(-)
MLAATDSNRWKQRSEHPGIGCLVWAAASKPQSRRNAPGDKHSGGLVSAAVMLQVQRLPQEGGGITSWRWQLLRCRSPQLELVAAAVAGW